MKNSHIEWCDHTFNPWIGCTKVSPGCANCYAETLTKRFWSHTHWGKGEPRLRTSAGNWDEPLAWNRKAAEPIAINWNQTDDLGTPARAFLRPRVFCASLADWLDDEVPIEWLADLLRLIHDTPNLDWLLLTKRPENFHARILDALAHVEGLSEAEEWPDEDPKTDVGWMLNEWENSTDACPDNVWLGVSIEDRARMDRIDQLRSIPAHARFLSVEPLLEQLGAVSLSGIHWVICGGESGPHARPMHPDWARSLRDQCQVAGIPFFFKQWGQTVRGDQITFGGVQDEEVVDDDRYYTITSKSDFRELDGREWNEFPKVEVPS